ncbi:hypothetical protein [Asticcacaulis machinosus]|uniref:Uncharacterized protein n=1 Tax=Asticcacaulis machinosus TaxID=2984211 RepID=A0ABT5HEG9_9CAUL|nr:hypothetical protein [Asticcacaulis machinosus]MDC7674644.1 hypothetical protein [Asticcacaulis machinosus]
MPLNTCGVILATFTETCFAILDHYDVKKIIVIQLYLSPSPGGGIRRLGHRRNGG